MTNKQVYSYYYKIVQDELGRRPKNTEVMKHIAEVCKVEERTVYRWFKLQLIPLGAQALIDLDTNSELRVQR